MISKINKYAVSLLICVSALLSADQNLILTPGTENSEIAKFNGGVLKEFDVFGYPAAAKERKKLTEAERSQIIEGYVMKLILQKEGNVPEVLNSEDYRKTYNSLLQKNEAEYLREDLINERFLSKKAKDEHYKKNPDKFI